MENDELKELKQRAEVAALTLAWGAIIGAVVIFLVLYLTSPTYGQTPQQRGPLGTIPSAEQIELGRKLFFDPRLSIDGTVSCATCHDPRKGWTDGLPLAIGVRGQRGTRNSPTIINASYVPLVFHDGRVAGLPAQALLPEVNPIEMGFQNIDQVIARLRTVPGYLIEFAQVYGLDQRGSNPINGTNLGLAIAAFESTVVSFDAPIDRYRAGDEDALTADAKIGYRIFEKANCMSCHKPPLYTDNTFHNNGMEFAGKSRPTDLGRFSVLPQRFRTPDTVRAFKTPTLREIARTAPYNHAGNFADLERVVIHYNFGGENHLGQRDRFTDPRIQRLNLSKEQRAYLVTFLKEAFASPNYPLIEEPMLP